ncbi:hypothetical protein BT93_A0449 [Corymbia citriodora subsp. variegata]|nr:hypothetical protein BT93_A0449 [Corymbia citriodora subsp. variegata]
MGEAAQDAGSSRGSQINHRDGSPSPGDAAHLNRNGQFVSKRNEKENAAPRSWANVARTAMRGYELRYITPTTREKEVRAVFDEEALGGVDPMWAECVVGYLIGKKLPFRLVETALKNAWELKLMEVKADDRGFFFFRIPDAEFRRRLLDNGPVTIARVPLILQQWHPLLELKKDNHSKVPVWIRLRNIPFTLWSSRGISGIASVIGNPLYVDQNTEQLKMLSYARVCVELDAADTRNDHVIVESSGVTCRVEVEYEWRPISCTKCGTFGHRCNTTTAGKNPLPQMTAAPVTLGLTPSSSAAIPAVVLYSNLATSSSVAATPAAGLQSNQVETVPQKLALQKADPTKDSPKPRRQFPLSLNPPQEDTTAATVDDDPGTLRTSQQSGQWQLQPSSRRRAAKKDWNHNARLEPHHHSLPQDKRAPKKVIHFDEAVKNLAGPTFSSADDLDDDEEAPSTSAGEDNQEGEVHPATATPALTVPLEPLVAGKDKAQIRPNPPLPKLLVSTRQMVKRKGHIWIGWNPYLVEFTSVFISSQIIHGSLKLLHTGSILYCTTVYGEHTYVARRPLWNDLIRLSSNLSKNPWIVAGDFNAIRDSSDRLGGSDLWLPSFDEFNECICQAELDDLQYVGMRYTWSTSSGTQRKQRKIDRVLVNSKWSLEHSYSEAVFLPPRISDHSPMLVRVLASWPQRRPFKFFNFWMSHPEFNTMVSQVWESQTIGNPMFKLYSRLKILKCRLKSLNKELRVKRPKLMSFMSSNLWKSLFSNRNLEYVG